VPPLKEAGDMVDLSLTGINWLAVIVAGIVAWVVGAIWYAPPVFGNRWMEMMGMKMEPGKMPEGAGKALGGESSSPSSPRSSSPSSSDSWERPDGWTA